MHIIYETNGKGFLGWITELPGAYVRGKTLEEARSKIGKEVIEYGSWLGIEVARGDGDEEDILESALTIEDADSDVIFPAETEEYPSTRDFLKECDWSLASALKVDEVYDVCKCKDAIDPRMVRKTFYGDVYATIQAQYDHIVQVQQYYLGQVGLRADVGLGIVEGRAKVIAALKGKYAEEGNRLYRNPGEDWSIRKIMRRLIWHDRIHAKAIARMNARIG